MRLLFAGVRGSSPVSAPQFSRVGGHTSCVAVQRDAGSPPALILDAGTGITNLARFEAARFDGVPFIGTILLTHLHWDHVQGLPFFKAADRDDARVTLALPAQHGHDGQSGEGDLGADPQAVLRRAMSPPHFPIGPEGLLGHWTFTGLEPGTYTVETFTVTAAEIPHKGGRTFGYRVSDGVRAFAYLPDHAPHGPDGSDAGYAAAVALADGVDLLVHGAPFIAVERTIADLYGHSTVDDAIELAERAGARRLVLTHHGPSRPDDAIDDLERATTRHFAREGDVIDL